MSSTHDVAVVSPSPHEGMPGGIPSIAEAPPPAPVRKLPKTAGRGGKRRGASYERELANYLSEALGIDVSRMPLSGGGRWKAHGGGGAADLTGLPGLHCEAKYVEKLSIWAAIAQAAKSKAKSSSPEAVAVITRRNRVATGESLVCMPLDHFLEFYKTWLRSHGYV